MLVSVAGASAATRFAAPGASGAAPACTEADPCSLFVAASESSPQPPAAGTEIVLLPGTYTDANNSQDLGPNHVVALRSGITLHGAAGKARPMVAASLNITSPLEVRPGDVISDLEVQTSANFGLFIQDGTVEDVVVRDSGNGGHITCEMFGSPVLRDSACLATGSGGIAVGANNGDPGSPVLRNVTAHSTGPGSFGLSFRYFGAAGVVDAKGVIAEGTATDVRAIGAEAGGSSTISLQNSDYATSEAKVEGGGAASVTEPATNGNITAPPLLAADGYHELNGSPTIDEGVLDGKSGTTDVDGAERKIGKAADIGADEFVFDPTATAVQCGPSGALANETITCSVDVKDAATTQNPSMPTGAVALRSDHRGVTPAPCTLEPVNGKPGEAHCELTFIPSEAALHQITAAYEGDGNHNPSASSTLLIVDSRPSATSVVCAPTSLVLGTGSITCTATVSDPGASPSAPGGTVKFSAAAGGSFANGGSCTLADAGEGKTDCRISYSPSRNGDDRITAAYRGDLAYNPSESSAPIEVKLGPPNTTIGRKPRARTASSVATFTFSSSQPGSHFQCKLDKGPFESCRSPFKHRVKPGRHNFQVRAVSSAGVADQTPAKFNWKVS